MAIRKLRSEREIMQAWKGDPTQPLVSVCCITYNHEPYIAQAIEGMLMQKTDLPIELIIGEDCSTNRTRELVVDYQKKHPDIIRESTSEKNVGMHKNGQRMGKACRGEYIALCEGDDYWIELLKL
jgi:Glycosyltransferases involved in cell wall biogenesis